MPRAQISSGLLTTQNQGGGTKKQGLPPTVGLGRFSFNLIQRKGGYCKCIEDNCGIIKITDIATLGENNTYFLNKDTTIRKCQKLIIDSIFFSIDNYSLINKGIIEVDGTGEIRIRDTTDFGKLINEGLININVRTDINPGLFINGILINRGRINIFGNNDVSVFNNQLSGIVNNSGGTIQEFGINTIANFGTFYNPQNVVGCDNGVIIGTVSQNPVITNTCYNS